MFKFILASLFMLQVFTTTTNYTVIMSTDASGNAAFLFTQGASGYNPTLFANVGDTLNFNVSASTNSPFSIHTAADSAGTSFSQYHRLTQSSPGVVSLVIGADTDGFLYYVSESATTAQGEIIITYNCSGVPVVNSGSAGSCIANSRNGTTCIPSCNTGYTGSLSAICINGSWALTSGSCSAVSGGSSTGSNSVVEYKFTVYGKSTNDCTYVTRTVVPSLNTWGNTNVARSGATFNAQLISCNNGANNGGSSFVIDVYVTGINADSAVTDEATFENSLENQLELDSAVTVSSIDDQRNSGFVMQASLIALLSIMFVALTH